MVLCARIEISPVKGGDFDVPEMEFEGRQLENLTRKRGERGRQEG